MGELLSLCHFQEGFLALRNSCCVLPNPAGMREPQRVLLRLILLPNVVISVYSILFLHVLWTDLRGCCFFWPLKSKDHI